MIPSTTTTSSASGNGATTSFSFGYKVTDAPDGTTAEEQVEVYVVSSTGEYTLQVYTVDYTITLNADQDASPGGAIVFGTAPASGKQIRSRRSPPFVQETDLVTQVIYRPETVERALDLATEHVQYLKEEASRALTVPLGFSGDLPSLEGAAGMHLIVNSDEDGFYFGSAVNSGTTVSAAMIPVVTASTLANARTAMGVLAPSSAMTPVVQGSTLSIARTAMGIINASAAMTPVVQAVTLAAGRAALGVPTGTQDMRLSLGDYSPDATGGSDSSTAVQNWLNACKSQGVGGFAPAGTYLINTACTLTNCDIDILGAGQELTKFKVNNTTGCFAFTQAARAVMQYRTTVRDMTFIASATGTNGKAISAIYPDANCDATKTCHFEGLSFRSTAGVASAIYWSNCIYTENAAESVFIDINISQNSATSCTGINFNNSTTSAIYGAFLSKINSQGCGTGIKVRGWLEDFHLESFSIAVPRIGIDIDCSGASAAPMPVFTIANGHANGSDMGIYITGCKSVHLANVNTAVVNDATSTLSTSYATRFYACQEITIYGGVANNAGTTATTCYCIAIQNSYKFNITGLQVIVTQYSGKTQYGMGLTNGAYRGTVSGCTFQCVVASGSAGTAVLWQTGSGSDDEITMANNRFRDYATDINVIDCHGGLITGNRRNALRKPVITIGGTRYTGLEVREPGYESAFLLTMLNATSNNTGDGTTATVVWDTTDKDERSNTAAGIFTAEADGLYRFDAVVTFDIVGAGHTRGYLVLLTTQKVHSAQVNLANLRASTNDAAVAISVLTPMLKGETARVQGLVFNSTKTVGYYGPGIANASNSWFSGKLENYL